LQEIGGGSRRIFGVEFERDVAVIGVQDYGHGLAPEA
jgi:hypothetical protein